MKKIERKSKYFTFFSSKLDLSTQHKSVKLKLNTKHKELTFCFNSTKN